VVHGIVILVALSACMLGCSSCSDTARPALSASAIRVAEEDAVFHQDPRWLGGDAAYSIELGGGRSLWLFGDSFIATSPARVRSEAAFIRNSVAVMTGTDLGSVTMQFAWREATAPTSFFAETGDHWFWPGGGVRVPGGPAIVFLNDIRPDSNEGLGFAGAGFTAVRIPDPSGPPAGWAIEPTTVAAPPFAKTSNVACTTLHDGFLYALVTGNAAHDGWFARWPLAALSGDPGAPTWWTGNGWTAQASVTGSPAVVVADGATECSLHFDVPTSTWVYVYSRGFGKTTVAVRTSSSVTGPWSAPIDALTPPESLVERPFVYAAKAHPQLRLDDGALLVTFADNSFTFADVLDPAKASTLYWPHVAYLSLTTTKP
jgi:hypothetical protein